MNAAQGLDLVLGSLGEPCKGKLAWAVIDGVVTITTVEQIRNALNFLSTSKHLHSANDAGDPQVQQTSPQAKAALAEINRIGRLRRVIDQKLWPQVQLDEQDAGSKDEGDHRTIPIILLARDVSRETLAQVKRAGMNIDDTAPSSNIIAGSIARDHLDDLAMLDAVRRIEAVNVN